eukprot:GFUD01033772.1.p1 GENE.GFUD01033772.1~~GFUD01033772.1.p1  ORF type:complete len:131 (+),score=4.15 GFUD01033772.1:38-394(+)
MFRSILLCSFLAYVSTTTEGTDGWFTGIWTDSVIEASTLTYRWFTETARRCKCSGVMVDFEGYGKLVEGEPVPELCSTTKEGRPFCFVYPSDCQDSVPSSQFPDLDWSYEACEGYQSF